MLSECLRNNEGKYSTTELRIEEVRCKDKTRLKIRFCVDSHNTKKTTHHQQQ
jgi:hypothetical protein